MTESYRSEARRRMYRRRRITVGVAALIVLALLGGGVYTAAVALTPLPQLRPVLMGPAERNVNAPTTEAEAAVAAQGVASAAGWLHDDEVWSTDDELYRIASITKLITALVGLEAAPIEAGSDGPTYTVTADDSRILAEIIAIGGSFAPAPIGLELTTRQMLDLMLVPSANNYAIAYARWVFGSDEAFLAAAADWLARQGLGSISIEDPTGLSFDNVGSAADLVRLSRLALEHPLVAEIVAQSRIEIPMLGEIDTTNRLLGVEGVVGVKTGTTFPAGYSLAAAQRSDIGGRELTAIAVVLDRADANERAVDAHAVLTGMRDAWHEVELVQAGERVATVTTWEGEDVALFAESGVDAVLVAGESASRSIEIAPLGAGAAGSAVGAVLVTSPEGEREIEVVTDAAIEEPSLWWRMTHPEVVFGRR